VNSRTLLLAVFLASTPLILCSGLPVPNRGTQLFVIISLPTVEGLLVVAMKPARRPVLQKWNRRNPTYDFVSAVVQHTADGSKVDFTRYVMAQDYIPRVEHLDLRFPFSAQPNYKFFDIGSITGFYRNPARDIDPREFTRSSTHLTKR
jgi:hypothetical protein